MNRTKSKYNVPIYPNLIDQNIVLEDRNNLKNKLLCCQSMERSFVENGEFVNQEDSQDLEKQSIEGQQESSLLLSDRSRDNKQCGQIVKKKVSIFLKQNMVDNPQSPRCLVESDGSLYEDLFSSKSMNRQLKNNCLGLSPVGDSNRVSKFSVVQQSRLSQLIWPTVYLETDLGMIELWSNGELYKVNLNYSLSKISNVQYTNWYIKYQYQGNDVLTNNMKSLQGGVKRLADYCEWVNGVGGSLLESVQDEFGGMIRECEQIFVVHRFITRRMAIVLVIHKDHSITIMGVKSGGGVLDRFPLRVCFSSPKCLVNRRELQISQRTFQKLASIYVEYWFMNVGDL